MSVLEAVCIGDTHLDKLTKYWSHANVLQISAIRRVLKQAIARGIKHAFMLGDVAEGIRDTTGNAMRLSESAQCALLALFKEFDGRIQIDCILGNHDWASEGSHSLQVFIEMQRLGMFETVKFHERPAVEKRSGIWCNFLPFPHTDPTDAKAQIAFAHYEVAGTVGDNGRRSTHDAEHDHAIPFIQGHLHTRQRVRNHYYPGTLYQTSFGESLPKGFMWFKTDGTKFKHKMVDLAPPFTLNNLHVHRREDLRQLTEDPLTLYKLFVADDVRVPDDLLLRYPNVVNRLAFSNEAELEALEFNEFKTENSTLDLDHGQILPDFLKQKGASPKQVRRGLELVNAFAKKTA